MCGIISLYFPFIFIFLKTGCAKQHSLFCHKLQYHLKNIQKTDPFYQINYLHRDIFLPYATCDRF